MWDISFEVDHTDSSRLLENDDQLRFDRYYNARKAITVSSIKVDRAPRVACISSQSYFVLAVEKKVSLFTYGCIKLIYDIDFENPTDCLALSDDSKLLLVGETNGFLHVFCIPTQTKILSLQMKKKDFMCDVTYQGAFFMQEDDGSMKICTLTDDGYLTMFRILNQAQLSEASKSKDFSVIQENVETFRVCLAEEYPGIKTSCMFDNTVDKDYPVGLAAWGLNGEGFRHQNFGYGITAFTHPFPGLKFIKASSSVNARFIVTLDSQYHIKIICCETLLFIAEFTRERVGDFILVEKEDIERFSGYESKIGMLVEMHNEKSADDWHCFMLCNLPSFDCIYKIITSELCFLSACKINQDCIYIVQGKAENPDFPTVISSLQVQVISESSPSARLQCLLREKKFDKAEEFAKFHKLDVQVIYRMKTICMLRNLSSTSNHVEISRIVMELNSLTSKIQDVSFIKACVELDISMMSCRKDLLLICKNWLENNHTSEEDKETLLPKVNLTINRILSYEVLNANNSYSLKWQDFISVDLLTHFIEELNHDRVDDAIVLWHRHHSEIIHSLNEEKVEKILHAIPEHMPSNKLINFLKEDFLFPVISTIPDVMDMVALWMTERMYLLEIIEKDEWPNNGKKLLEVFTYICDDLREELLKGRLNFSVDIKLHSIHKKSLNVECPIGHCLELIRNLNDLVFLKKKFNCHLTLLNYHEEKKMKIVFSIIDGIEADLIGLAITEFLHNYSIKNGMCLDSCLSYYIKEVLQNTTFSWWYHKKAPWEDKLLAVVSFIQHADTWMDSVNAVAFHAPVPWSNEIKILIDKGLKLNHPKKEALEEHVRFLPVKQILILYDFIDFPVKQDIELAQTLIGYILKQGTTPDSLEVILKISKAYNMPEEEAYLAYLRFLLNDGKIQDMMDTLYSVSTETSLSCSQSLLNYAVIYLKRPLRFELEKQKRSHMITASLLLTRYLNSKQAIQQDDMQSQIIRKLQKEFDLYVSLDEIKSAEYCWNIIDKATASYFSSCGYSKQASQHTKMQSIPFCCSEQKEKVGGQYTIQKIFRLSNILMIERAEVMSYLILQSMDYGCYDHAVCLSRELVSSCKNEVAASYLMAVIQYFYIRFDEIKIVDLTLFMDTLGELVCSALKHCSKDLMCNLIPIWQHVKMLKIAKRLCAHETLSERVKMGSSFKMWRFYPIYRDEGLWIEEDEAKLLLDKTFIEFFSFASNFSNTLSYLSDVRIQDIIMKLVITFRQKGQGIAALHVIFGILSTTVGFVSESEAQNGLQLFHQIQEDLSPLLEEITYFVLHKVMNARNPDLMFTLGILKILPLKKVELLYKELENLSGTDLQRKITFYSVASEFCAFHNDKDKALEFSKKQNVILWVLKHMTSISLSLEDIIQVTYPVLCSLITEMTASESMDVHAILQFLKILGFRYDDDVTIIFLKNLFFCKKKKDDFSTSKIMQKEVIRSLSHKAEDIITVFRNQEYLLSTLKDFLKLINPYFYELLLYLHKKVLDISSRLGLTNDEFYLNGMKLLKFLMTYKRVSQPTETEKENWNSEKISELPVLAQFRLPFHPLIKGSGQKIINQELNFRTVSLWLDVASVLKQKNDELIVIAIQNSVSDYVIHSKLHSNYDCSNYTPDLSFLTNLKEMMQEIKDQELSVACASRVTSMLLPGANKVLVAEATSFLARQYATSCNEKKVSDMALKMDRSYQLLLVRMILDKENLFNDAVKSMISYPEKLIKHLIENSSIPAVNSEKVYKAAKQIADISELDLSEIYLRHICYCLAPVSAIPSDDETFISFGQNDLVDTSNKTEVIRMERAICSLLGLPYHVMVDVLESLSKILLNQSTAHKARFWFCLVSVADTDLVASISGLHFSHLMENLRQLTCIAGMNTLHLPYSIDMFCNCNKLDLVENILNNQARERKVLIFCIKMCSEFNLCSSQIWLIILQKLSEMLMVEDLQRVLWLSTGKFPILWSNRTFVNAWSCCLASLLKIGECCDGDVNKNIKKRIYVSLLRCPFALDMSDFLEKFKSLLPKEDFGSEPLDMHSIISVLREATF